MPGLAGRDGAPGRDGLPGRPGEDARTPKYLLIGDRGINGRQ